MKTLMLSDDEIKIARQFFDVALKHLGGRAAQAYVVLDTKFARALAPVVEQKPEVATDQKS